MDGEREAQREREPERERRDPAEAEREAQASGSDAAGKQEVGEILNVRDVVTRRRTRLAALIERTGKAISSPALFVGLLVSHAVWVVANLPFMPWEPWDPYPFTFLATVASVEAPFLALLILLHQQRQERIDELREEFALQVSLQTERETTQILRVLRRMGARFDIDPAGDPAAMDRMSEELDAQALLESVRRHLHEEEGGGPTEP